MLPRQSDAGIESGLSADPESTDFSGSKHLSRWAIFTILSICLYVGYTLHPLVNSAYYETLRREWYLEKRHHENLRDAWNAEMRHHETLRRVEERRHENLRDAWAAETRHHVALQGQMNQERKIMEEERKDWAREREEHERRQKEQERRRHDDEVKKRAGISWEGLEAGEHCLRYATREYTAILTHVPAGLDALEECRKKPIEVHGNFVIPSRCEDQVRIPISFIKHDISTFHRDFVAGLLGIGTWILANLPVGHGGGLSTTK